MDIINHYKDEPPSRKRRKNNEEVTSDIEDLNGNNYKETIKNTVKKSRKNYIPKFRLKTAGDNASITTITSGRVPLLLTDVQHLLLHSLLGNLNLSQPPRWYVLDRCCNITQSTCLVFEGVSLKHWEKHNGRFTFAKKTFNEYVELLTPSVYNGSLVQELALVPLSDADKEALILKYGSMNLALEARKDLMVMMRAVFPIKDENSENVDLPSNDKFPRTHLVLSAWQLVDENYPLPLKGKLKDAYSDYVMTREEYMPVTNKSPMFGLDCEMCITSAGSELTRVSIVNEKYEVIYESLVKPYNSIIDYLTRYSGITKTLLSDVTKRLEDVQKDIGELLPPDAILIGQSLNIDLHALKMMHPYIIDTSVIYNFTGDRARKPKLKALAREFLQLDIQSGKNGHCPTEDSIASVKLVQLKLSKNIEFGDAVHTNRQQYKKNFVKEIGKAPEYAFSIFNHMIEQKKSSVVVGLDDITGDYHSYLATAKDSLNAQLKKHKIKRVKLITVDEIEEVISTVSKAVGEYNFAMGHLKFNLSEENELNYIEKIDKWIETVWKCMPSNALCVVVFGGTASDNGVAMINIKNTL